MGSPLHELIVYTFASGFYKLEHSLPVPLRGSVLTRTNLRVLDFEGTYQDSTKVPDVIAMFRNPAGDERVFVVEVGFSETYSELVQDVHMWLNGNRNATIAVLVKLNESPAYCCPIQNLNGQDLKRLELLGIPRPSDFDTVQEYGPILHNGMV